MWPINIQLPQRLRLYYQRNLFRHGFIRYLLHEMLTSRMVVGAVLILLAILIAEVKPAHPKRS